jgi:hypothetical protein
MMLDQLRVGSVISGPFLPEPVEVLAVIPLGESIKLIAKGCRSGLVRDPVLTRAQLGQLHCTLYFPRLHACHAARLSSRSAAA